MQVDIPDDWRPTPENINGLPPPLQDYIHELEARADPAGDVQTIALLKDQVEALQKRSEADMACPRCGHVDDRKRH